MGIMSSIEKILKIKICKFCTLQYSSRNPRWKVKKKRSEGPVPIMPKIALSIIGQKK